MALIPEYPIINYGAKPLDFSPLENVIQQKKQEREKAARESRQRYMDIEDKVNNLDIAASKLPEFQNQASDRINELRDHIGKIFTYEGDGKGGFTNKLKRQTNGEPQISDKEYVDIMSKFTDISKSINSSMQSVQAANEDTEAFKKDKGDNFDPITFSKYMGDFEKGGKYVKGSALDQKSIDPQKYFSDPKLDPTYEERSKNPIETIQGDNIKKVIPDLDPVKRDMIYYSEARNNYGVGKGLVDNMIADKTHTTREKLDYIKGILLGDRINDTSPQGLELQNKAESSAVDMLQKYDQQRKFDPSLIEAAAHYNADPAIGIKMNENIGKGMTSIKPDESLHREKTMEAINEADKEKDSKKPIQEVERTFSGKTYNNYIDLSTQSPDVTTVKNYKLPKDAVKYVEKVNLNTGKREPVGTHGDKAVGIKNPVETKTTDDYRVAGYDKQKGIIRLVKANEKALTEYEPSDDDNAPKIPISKDEESYIIPYQGNEYMIDESFKKAEGKKSSAVPDKPLKKINGW
jgi:hypothetical protein